MHDLNVPTRELACRVLQEVDFEHRLVGGYLHQRAGTMTLSLFSVEDVFALLNSSWPQIDPAALEHWVRDVIGDEELSDSITTVLASNSNQQETLNRIRDLLGLRLIQCRQALAA